MKDKKTLLATCYLLLATCSIGCVGIQKKDLPKEQSFLETATFLKFTDVPIPTGFKFLSESSYLVESGALRSGLLKYTGKATGDQVTNFYKEQMPMYGWRLLNLVEYGERILNFEKESESCVITIKPSSSKSDLTISLAPRPSFIERKTERKTEKSEKPIK